MNTLYVSDLDGTLLAGNGKISAASCRVLNELTAGGVWFTYATARSLTSSLAVTEGLRLHLPVITYNGAAIMDPRTGNPVMRFLIPPEAVRAVREIARTEGIPFLIDAVIGGEEKVSWLRGGENQGIRSYLASRGGDRRLRPADTLEELFAGDLFYFFVIGTREEMEPVRARLRGIPGCAVSFAPDVYDPEEWWVEVRREGVSKAAAISTLKQMLGAERAVCFGDHLNDISMFRACDESYAVANARGELKAIATGVIAGNDTDGVAAWLREHATV